MISSALPQFPIRNQSAQMRIDRRAQIQKIALQTLAELGVSLAFAGIVSFFAPVAISALLIPIGIQCVCTLAIRLFQMFYPRKDLSFPRGLIFGQMGGSDIQTLIHESGHALGAHLVYQNADPKITIYPLRGGLTSFDKGQLSRTGELLGRRYSLALVTVAGPLLTLMVSSILIWVGIQLQQSHPELSGYLLGYGITDFATHAYYATSALWTSPDLVGHDFVRLSQIVGLHPIVAAVAIVAIPILILGCARTTRPQT